MWTWGPRVYSLKADGWKDIGGIPLFHLNYKAAIWLGNDFLIQKATSMIGRTGWYLIVSYDMSREEFKEITRVYFELRFGNSHGDKYICLMNWYQPSIFQKLTRLTFGPWRIHGNCGLWLSCLRELRAITHIFEAPAYFEKCWNSDSGRWKGKHSAWSQEWYLQNDTLQ